MHPTLAIRCKTMYEKGFSVADICSITKQLRSDVREAIGKTRKVKRVAIVAHDPIREAVQELIRD